MPAMDRQQVYTSMLRWVRWLLWAGSRIEKIDGPEQLQFPILFKIHIRGCSLSRFL